MLHLQGNYLLKQKKQTMAVLQMFRRHNTQGGGGGGGEGGGGADNATVGVCFFYCSYTFSMVIVEEDWFRSFIKSSTSVSNERKTK